MTVKVNDSIVSDEHSPVPKVVQPLKPAAVNKLLPVVGKPKNSRLSIPATGSLPSAPTRVLEECSQHLHSIGKQLHHLISLYRTSPQLTTARLANLGKKVSVLLKCVEVV